MKKLSLPAFLLSILIVASCKEDNSNEMNKTEPPPKGTYAYDKDFLLQYDSNLVELKSGKASILVSPVFQAKVFTSTAEGDSGKSFGWINYKVFGGPVDPHMNAFGGENRFWLGPEGGKYSLYFRKGDSMIFKNWKTPPPIDTEHWNVEKKDARSVTLTKDMNISNYAGSNLYMQVTRTVSMQDRSQVEKTLSIDINDSLPYVGYSTVNVLKNTGDSQWNAQSGMPCIWMLDMFNPSDSTVVIVPHKPAKTGEKVATTNYFGEIPGDRIKITDSTLFFKADGKSRGKLGILPQYALPFAGSYDAQNNVLTITYFTIDNKAKYLNQEWTTSKPAFSGDAMNAYNDGPLEDATQMGPFYEIESVSPAAELKPSASIEHIHNVYHFTGNRDQLDRIAQKVLGVSLHTIQSAFK